MSSYRTLNQLILAKLEVTPGTDSVPVPGTDAVLVENPTRNPDLGTVETNEVTGALDDRGPIAAGGSSPFTADVWMKGSGTQGTAPEYGPLLIGCAMAETLLGTAVTGTASTGSASSITLDTGDDDNLAIGMVIRLTAGTGSGQSRVITALPGADVVNVFPDWTVTPDATSVYSVDAQATYAPASTSLQTVSIYRYRNRSDAGNSKLDKVLGAAGTWTLNMPVRSPGRLSFSYRGQLSAPTDVTPPVAGVFDDVRPYPYLNAQTYLGSTAIKLNTLSMDFGSAVQMIDNPAQAFGFDSAGVTRRRVSGRLNPPLELQATRDAFSSWLNGTTQSFWVQWGSTAGNQVSVYIPSLLYTGVEEEDVTGFAHEGLPFRAIGQDTGVYISMY